MEVVKLQPADRTSVTSDPFAPFEQALRGVHAAPIVVETFRYHFGQLASGQTGLIPESEIGPVTGLQDADALPDRRGQEALSHTAVIRLNGGLGTSMGLDGPKSLLVAKDGLTFLDVIVRQILALRQETSCSVPLLFMDSFATDEETRAALRAYGSIAVEGLPLTFLQNQIPKVLEDGFGLPDPVRWGEQAWCPPGHGDLYTALHGSHILERLLDRGFHYAFVSNADNLGATLDLRILGYVADKQIPFLMEVADRTEADRKGGHLARRKRDGRLLLREVAQSAPEDMPSFQDILRHRYFNTNSIWLDLRAVRRLLDRSGGIFRLPLIRNRKPIDPRDSSTPSVLQLETAMGAAIELFDGAQAMRVPRSRFAPVKLCSDLLVLWSDAYVLQDDFHLAAAADPLPMVGLDPRHYRLVDDLRRRFPHGAPSLRECVRLEVDGDVTFGRDVVIRGRTSVTAEAPRHVGDGSVLEGEIRL